MKYRSVWAKSGVVVFKEIEGNMISKYETSAKLSNEQPKFVLTNLSIPVDVDFLEDVSLLALCELPFF